MISRDDEVFLWARPSFAVVVVSRAATARLGANDALGATVFDPDAPSHLAHCLLLLAKAARQQRILQHRAREAENAKALDTYAGFYHQLREARDGR